MQGDLPFAITTPAASCVSAGEGNHGVFPSSEADLSFAILVHPDLLARATVIGRVSSDQITVGALRKAGLLPRALVVAFVAKREESLVAPGERDEVVARCVPVGDRSGAGGVTEARHVADLFPAMFADPVTHAGGVLVELRRQRVTPVTRWRSLIRVTEFVGAHDPRSSVVPG